MQTMEPSAITVLSGGEGPMEPRTRTRRAPGEVAHASAAALIQQAVADQHSLDAELARLLGAVHQQHALLSQQHALLRQQLDDITQHLAAAPGAAVALPATSEI